MLQDTDIEAAQNPVVPPPPAAGLSEVQENPAAKERLIRYTDDDDFRRHLAEVVIKHDRLLAKLAE